MQVIKFSGLNVLKIPSTGEFSIEITHEICSLVISSPTLVTRQVLYIHIFFLHIYIYM